MLIAFRNSFAPTIVCVLLIQALNVNLALDTATMRLIFMQFLVLAMSYIAGNLFANGFFRSKVDGVSELYIVGYLSISALMIPLVFFLDVPILDASGIVFALVLIVSPIVCERIKLLDVKGELLIAAAASLVVVLYCYPRLTDFQQVIVNGGKLPLHIDLIFQGGTLEQVARGNEFGQIYLRDAPAIIYHYASFMLPALLMELSDIRGIDVLAVWTIPFGLLLLVLSIRDFTSTYFKSKSLSWWMLLLVFLPDPSRYTHNSLYDVHYLLLASPGTLYGLALSFVILNVFKRGLDSLSDPTSLRNNFFYLSWLLIVLFNVRFHFFSLISIYVLFALITYKFGLLTLKKTLLIWLVVFLVTQLQPFYTAALFDFLRFNTSFISPGWLQGAFIASTKIPVIALLFVLMFSTGIAFLYLIWISKKPVKTKADHLPLNLSYAYLILITLVPVPHYGDSTEFTQRPFVLVYFVLTIFSLHRVSEYFANTFSKGAVRNWLAVLLVCVSTIMLSWLRPYGVPIWHPWHNGSFHVSLDTDLIKLSDYLRLNSNKDDTLFMLPQRRGDFSLSKSIQLSSLSGRHSYLTRPAHYLTSKNSKASELVSYRLSLSDTFEQNGLTDELLSQLKSDRVRYLIINSDDVITNSSFSNIQVIDFGKYTLVKVY